MGWRATWPCLLAALLVASAANGRRRRQPDAQPVPLSLQLELNELKAHLAGIRDKLTLGEDAQAECASLGKTLSDLALSPAPEARTVVADALRLCNLDVPISHAQRGLQAGIAEMTREQQRSDPDQMVPYWIDLKAACDEAGKTVVAVTAAGFENDAKTRALSDSIATDCVEQNLVKPERHHARWPWVLLCLVLVSAGAAAATYLWQQRRRRPRPVAPVVPMTAARGAKAVGARNPTQPLKGGHDGP